MSNMPYNLDGKCKGCKYKFKKKKKKNFAIKQCIRIYICFGSGFISVGELHSKPFPVVWHLGDIINTHRFGPIASGRHQNSNWFSTSTACCPH